VNNEVDRFEAARFTDNVVYCEGLRLSSGRAARSPTTTEATLVIPSAATGIHLQRSNNGVGADDARWIVTRCRDCPLRVSVGAIGFGTGQDGGGHNDFGALEQRVGTANLRMP
jgi:hypothetical protein